jgi:2-polyprenyl-6-methoxyphenol hydroxylase-like FAD-dependent oxidoreductase
MFRAMPDSAKPLHVAIAGAGFAGLAAATWLARAGHRVRVVERFEKPQSIGAGILIQPTGLASLGAMGLEAEVLARGAKVTSLFGVTPTGGRVVDLKYCDWRPGAFGLGLHRGVLFEALWRAANAAGVHIETGRAVDDLDALARDVDLTVIADGAHSKLRAQAGIAFRHRDYPWGALWAVVPDPLQSFTTAGVLRQWYRRAGQMLGVMPTGQRPDDGVPVVSLFWSLRTDQLQATRNAGIDEWKRSVRALTHDADAVLDQIGGFDQLTFAHYADVSMPQYHNGNVVVIGDAAHATSPQLGQGANMALLDAFALARCMARHARVGDALSDYTRERRTHLAYFGAMSRALTPLFQGNGRVLPWLRDVFMARAASWPIARDFNLQTLVGAKGGWLASAQDRWLSREPLLPAGKRG